MFGTELHRFLVIVLFFIFVGCEGDISRSLSLDSSIQKFFIIDAGSAIILDTSGQTNLFHYHSGTCYKKTILWKVCKP
jgi:hypothetical protein